ncbi:MAG TPA: hypothetical protein VGG34_01370 [Opitutaceae bacterium]
MVAATLPRHKPKAAYPFVKALADEFGLSKGHILRVLSGERASPFRSQLIRRQRELIREAKAAHRAD